MKARQLTEDEQNEIGAYLREKYPEVARHFMRIIFIDSFSYINPVSVVSHYVMKNRRAFNFIKGAKLLGKEVYYGQIIDSLLPYNSYYFYAARSFRTRKVVDGMLVLGEENQRLLERLRKYKKPNQNGSGGI